MVVEVPFVLISKWKFNSDKDYGSKSTLKLTGCCFILFKYIIRYHFDFGVQLGPSPLSALFKFVDNFVKSVVARISECSIGFSFLSFSKVFWITLGVTLPTKSSFVAELYATIHRLSWSRKTRVGDNRVFSDRYSFKFVVTFFWVDMYFPIKFPKNNSTVLFKKQNPYVQVFSFLYDAMNTFIKRPLLLACNETNLMACF